MATVTLRFYAELNDFLAPERRQRDWTIECVAPIPVRHLIAKTRVMPPWPNRRHASTASS